MAKDLGSGSGLLTAALPWVQGDPKSTVSFVPFVEQLGRAASLGFYCQCCSLVHHHSHSLTGRSFW